MGTSLAVQRLRLCTSTAEGTGLIPGRETKILKTVWCGQKKKKKYSYEYVRKGEWTKDLNKQAIHRRSKNAHCTYEIMLVFIGY